MWFMVCRWPQSQEGDWARPHLCKLARHGPMITHLFIKKPFHVYDIGTFSAAGLYYNTMMCYSSCYIYITVHQSIIHSFTIHLQARSVNTVSSPMHHAHSTNIIPSFNRH